MPGMTGCARERFIAAQLEGLKALGFGPDATAREERLLRAGFAQREMLAGAAAPAQEARP